MVLVALIKCPECENEVSTKAKACPACGFPISEMSQEETEQIIKQGEKEEKQKAIEEAAEEIQTENELIIHKYKRNLRSFIARTVTFWFLVITFLSGLNFEVDDFCEDFMLLKFPLAGLLSLLAAFLVADGVQEFFNRLGKTIGLIVGSIAAAAVYIVPIAIAVIIVFIIIGGIAMTNADAVVLFLMVLVSVPAIINLILGIKELFYIIANRNKYNETKNSIYNKLIW